MLYREIIAVSSEIHTRHIHTLCGQNLEFVNVKPGGTYNYHWDIEGNYHAVMYCGVTVSRISNLITSCRHLVKLMPQYALYTNLCGSIPPPVYRPCVQFS
jgi:hypothetical protein